MANEAMELFIPYIAAKMKLKESTVKDLLDAGWTFTDGGQGGYSSFNEKGSGWTNKILVHKDNG